MPTETFRFYVDSAESNAEDEDEEESNWDLSTRYRDIQRLGNLTLKQKLELSDRAVQGIITRAHELLGPIQKPYRQEICDLETLTHKLNHADLNSVELDVEATLSDHSGLGAQKKPQFEIRYQRDHGLILVLDTSLSMKGEKLAFLATAVAAVALSVPSQALAILGFDSEIHAIKSFHDADQSVQNSVQNLLSIPPGGLTHLALGLSTAQKWIQSSRYPQARILVISDGRVTEGTDPVILARDMNFVHSIKIGKDAEGRTLMRDLATVGSGHYFEVREMSELPGVLLNAIRTGLR